MRELFIGIDLGGTNIKIGCFDKNLNVIFKTSIPTEAELGPESIVEKIGHTIEQKLQEFNSSLDCIKSVGIGSPGVMDIENGIVITANNLKFKNVPLRKLVSNRLGNVPTVLENDANVTCWAEHVKGAGKGIDEMIVITLGTGVGGGIISNGELVHGYGNNAGELGHIIMHPHGRLCSCGQRGCVEAYGSASSTAARAMEAIQDGAKSSLEKLMNGNIGLDGKDVYDHAAAGDPLALRITEGTAISLAILCVGLLHVTGPRKIIFYGGMIGAGDLLLNPIKEYFKRNIWHLKEEKLELCFAKLGPEAGILGAAALAMHELEKNKI